MPITLDQADKIIKGARDKANELGIKVSIAVVDSGGHLIALSRMDGARFLTIDMSRGKAFTSVAFYGETEQLAQRMGQNMFFGSGPGIAQDKIVMLPGGIPIREGEQVIGAVGVGGGTGEQDVECAKAGLSLAGM
jgi:cob(I)alamin adenosyltransferase